MNTKPVDYRRILKEVAKNISISKCPTPAQWKDMQRAAGVILSAIELHELAEVKGTTPEIVAEADRILSLLLSLTKAD